MGLQARAEATRRRILDAAVDLFAELGYGETGLADVLLRAGVSKGAFYYHFDSKETVASAIIDDFSRLIVSSAVDIFDPAAPALEDVIKASFNTADIIGTNKLARVGNELMQAVGQISTAAPRTYSTWTTNYIDILNKAVGARRLRDGVAAEDVSEMIWAALLGCHLLSGAIGDDPFARLARTWRAVLRLLAPEDPLSGRDDLLDGVAASYRDAVRT